MGSRGLRSLAIAAVVSLLAVGCTGNGASGTSTGGDPATPTNADSASPTEPQDVSIVAVDYAYSEAPAELEAGVINLTFENQGMVGHEATLTGIGDTPIQQFVEDLGGRGGTEGFAYPAYVDQVLVPSFVSVQGGLTGEATFTISEGRYALWCAIPDVAEGDEQAFHYELGMIREVTVTAGDPEPQLPEADGSITASDYAFDVELEAGDRTVNFINDGPDQVHFSTVEVFSDDVDAGEAENAMEARLAPGPPPQAIPTTSSLGFSGWASTGLGNTFRLSEDTFESGRTYLFSCCAADREGGKPHLVAYGMYAIVTIE